MTQYLNREKLEEIKRTIMVLDNTNDKLVEIIPGVLAFLNSVGLIRLINLNTLDVVNTEPLKIEGIVNNKIILRTKIRTLGSPYRSMVIDLDTYEIILDLSEDLSVAGDLIYTDDIGVVNTDKQWVTFYNSDGKIIFESYVNHVKGIIKIGNTNIYMYVYVDEYVPLTNIFMNSTKTKYSTSFLKYDILNKTLKEIAVLDEECTLDIISEHTAIITRNQDDESIANVLDFALIESEDTNELSKLIDYKINL